MSEQNRSPLTGHTPDDPSSLFRRQPLSITQERLWFLCELQPILRAFNVAISLQITGPLRVEIFKRCLSEIFRRHEILRTSFERVDGQVCQIIDTDIELPLEIVELSDLLPEQAEAEAQQRAEKEAQKPFDLPSRIVPIRTTLLTVSDENHHFIVVMHRLVADEPSTALFVQELLALYETFSAGDDPILPDPPIQFTDLAARQRERIEGKALTEEYAYWKKQLGTEQDPLELPSDRTRPPVKTYQGAEHILKLPNELIDRITELGREQGISLSHVLFAGFAVLLNRYTGRTDLLVGYPTSGRSSVETQSTFGPLANIIPVSVELDGDPTFREAIRRVRDVTHEAFLHQELPFERLVEEFHPQRNLSHPPILQIMFDFRDRTVQNARIADVTFSRMDIESVICPLDLILSVRDDTEGFSASFQYSTDLFEPHTIERMTEHLITLLASATREPDTPVSKLNLLPHHERAMILEWNAGTADYQRKECLHELFEIQVATYPNATAVTCEGASLSYTELNARANQLARYLQAMNIGCETLVGLCLERSLDMVVAILGVLKAGGAYVPLDLAYPPERLRAILEDAACPVLLTESARCNDIPETTSRIICLDQAWTDIASFEAGNLHRQAEPDNLAYVIYTSGSTGTPKGTLITHSNVVRLFEATQHWFGFTQDDVWTLFHSYAFDFSVWELWGALLYGGRLVVVPYLVSRSPESFYQLLVKEKVTVLSQTPLAFRQLMQYEESTLSIEAADLALRYVIFGGERLDLLELEPWFCRHGDTLPKLINMYGITETTVHVTYRPLIREDIMPGMGSRIGQAIPDLRLFVLDPQMNPVPIGVPGELFVGGAGLARGYLNRPELTAERFITGPSELTGNDRLYRTGDLVKYLPNGDLEYLGRIDQQVKIRGFRVELGEIETALGFHPAVRKAVVLVRKDHSSSQYLTAYVVKAREVDEGILRTHLRERLPEYMIPTEFVFLDTLPLTSNGKLDRRALPTPDRTRIHHKTTYSAPKTEVEAALTSIWQEVLDRTQVGVDDDFFDLGGHSLLATQAISRMRSRFNVEMPLQSLFQHTTIRQLARQIETARQAGRRQVLPEIVPGSRITDPPLSFAQQRLWFLEQWQPGLSAYNVAFLFRLEGQLDVNALEGGLNEIVRRHEMLRTTFQEKNGEAVQVIAPFKPFTLTVTDLTQLPEGERDTEVRRITSQSARHPYTLTIGPLFRLKIFKIDTTRHVLAAQFHHIVVDGWSIGVFLNELAVLYNTFAAGAPCPLPALTIQYADFACWQTRCLQNDTLAEDLNYWKKQLAGASPVLDLPTDRPRPPMQTFRGATVSFALSQTLTDRLRTLSQNEGVTLFTALLAAWKVLLFRYTEQEDITVGCTVAARTRQEIEGLIGFFVNTLPMRTSFSGNPTFKELLARERDIAMNAYDHQELPFERLVAELHPERETSHAPIFQVLFAPQNVPASGTRFQNIEVTAEEIDNGTSKFDLTLSATEERNGIALALEYNTDLFVSETIRRLIDHWQTLIEALVTTPDVCVCDLSLLNKGEEHTILREWNATRRDFPQVTGVHHFFEAQSRRTPSAVAVVSGKMRTTYRELNQRAEVIAIELQKQGFRHGTAVAVYLERSIEMMACVLGVLKSGAAYVPMDTSYPSARITLMIEDANVPVILTQKTLTTRLPETQVLIIFVEDISHNQEGATITANTGGHDTDLAYIIFTSGSTGRPKGVAMPHKALVNLIQWQLEESSADPYTNTLQFTSLSFDVSFQEMFSTWASGGTLVLIDEDTRRDPVALLKFIEAQPIHRMFLPFVALQQLAETAVEYNTFPQCLHEVITAGEQLRITRHVRQWFEALPNCVLYNQYGPSESHVVTAFALREQAAAWPTHPPIGRPIANVTLYILDEKLRPVPIGFPGELYIGGVALADGYIHRPELPVERFKTNPFDNKSPARFYKTGDKARYLPSGDIEFLGRLDDQVKIRGYRVELRELESVLEKHPAVREVAVQARGNTETGSSGEKSLVAYVVPESKEHGTNMSCSPENLRTFLASELPPYMVPQTFVFLDALPLTPSGKVDKKALPAPISRTETRQGNLPPRTPLEERIASIWSNLLGLTNLSIDDNFFDLGGHSLLATQAISRIRTALRVELPLRKLFETPTIAGLALAIEEALIAELEMLSDEEATRLTVEQTGGFS